MTASAARASRTAWTPSARKRPVSRRARGLVSPRADASRALFELSRSGSRRLSGGATDALGGDGLLGHCHQRGEGRLVGDREFGQDLAVGLHAGQSQALDEPVVGHVDGPGGGVDPGDPQLAEVTLAGLAVPVGVGRRVQQLLLGLAVQPGPLAPVAGGCLEGGPALLLGVDRPLDACHVGCPCSSGRPGPAGESSLGQRPSIRLTRGTSTAAIVSVPVRRRVSLDDLRSSRWRLPARSVSNLPLPVTLTRFFIPEWVLFL